MLYYIYIGNGQTAIDHLSKVTDGMFVTVSCADKAAVIIDGIRERYNTSILYEQTDPGKDCLDIACLHRRFPRVYITLITEGLQAEERKAYLLAGVSNTLPPQADAESIRSMTRFLQIRQKHKMQEFSRTHRKMLNTFHLPAWNARSTYYSPHAHWYSFLRCSSAQPSPSVSRAKARSFTSRNV